MGTYVYTLRKRTLNLHHDGPDGETSTPANFMSYAYKEWLSSSWDTQTEARRNFIRDSAQRTAENAWHETDHALVVMADEKAQDGDAVYADLQRPLWYDTDRLPARLVGYLQKRGGRWYLVDAGKWEPRHYNTGKRWGRYRAIDGKAVLEEVPDSESHLPSYENGSRWEMFGQDYPKIVDPRQAVEIQVTW